MKAELRIDIAPNEAIALRLEVRHAVRHNERYNHRDPEAVVFHGLPWAWVTSEGNSIAWTWMSDGIHILLHTRRHALMCGDANGLSHWLDIIEEETGIHRKSWEVLSLHSRSDANWWRSGVQPREDTGMRLSMGSNFARWFFKKISGNDGFAAFEAWAEQTEQIGRNLSAFHERRFDIEILASPEEKEVFIFRDGESSRFNFDECEHVLALGAFVDTYKIWCLSDFLPRNHYVRRYIMHHDGSVTGWQRIDGDVHTDTDIQCGDLSMDEIASHHRKKGRNVSFSMTEMIVDWFA